MKKLIAAIALLTLLSLAVGDFLNPQGSLIAKTFRQLTDGSLAFTVRTSTYNGPYAPANAGVIWITNSQNQFVKTIKIWANTYRYTLIRWINSSGQNMQGAITSASLNNHQLHSITWNGKDYQGNNVPDGDYKVNVEFTEHNANTNNMGKYKQISFTKGTEPVVLTIPNETYFKDMTLNWTPVIENGTLSGLVSGIDGNPIPNAVISAGDFVVFSGGDGSYNLSLQPGVWDVTCVVDGYNTQIIPDVIISSLLTTTLNFNLMPVSNSDLLNPQSILKLSNPSPNPFSGNTSISFSSKPGATTQAAVYNLKGQLVRTLSELKSGNANWDGTNNRGLQCPNGVYIVRVQSGTQSASRKVVLNR